MAQLIPQHRSTGRWPHPLFRLVNCRDKAAKLAIAAMRLAPLRPGSANVRKCWSYSSGSVSLYPLEDAVPPRSARRAALGLVWEAHAAMHPGVAAIIKELRRQTQEQFLEVTGGKAMILAGSPKR